MHRRPTDQNRLPGLPIHDKDLLGEEVDRAKALLIHSKHEQCFLWLRYGVEQFSCTDVDELLEEIARLA